MILNCIRLQFWGCRVEYSFIIITPTSTVSQIDLFEYYQYWIGMLETMLLCANKWLLFSNSNSYFNHIIVYKLLVLDRNAWNNRTVYKQMIIIK